MLLDLKPDCIQQGELDLGENETMADVADKTRLMSALDAINQRYGKGAMKLASAGLSCPVGF